MKLERIEGALRTDSTPPSARSKGGVAQPADVTKALLLMVTLTGVGLPGALFDFVVVTQVCTSVVLDPFPTKSCSL